MNSTFYKLIASIVITFATVCMIIWVYYEFSSSRVKHGDYVIVQPTYFDQLKEPKYPQNNQEIEYKPSLHKTIQEEIASSGYSVPPRSIKTDESSQTAAKIPFFNPQTRENSRVPVSAQSGGGGGVMVYTGGSRGGKGNVAGGSKGNVFVPNVPKMKNDTSVNYGFMAKRGEFPEKQPFAIHDGITQQNTPDPGGDDEDLTPIPAGNGLMFLFLLVFLYGCRLSFVNP
ncbi:MAG: hypothetical protein LBS07_03015 [Prevotellaceae bacterium]|jgi:hypothetical protein|nr:hypothetical protein [Prevotellaceae bacterium]